MTHLFPIRSRRNALTAVVAALWFAATAAMPGDLPDHDEVEAAYLYRIAGFVDWPEQPASSPEFTIAVMGSDSIVRSLERILPQHPLRNRPAHVRRISRLSEMGDAQMLFLGTGRNDDLKEIISRVGNRPVLVVTASDHGLDEGACLNFLVVDRRVRIEVSLSAADRAGLKVSAELLAVAVRVQGAK